MSHSMNMKDLLFMLVIATTVGTSTAQTKNLLPCAIEYYKEICSVEGGIPSWIRDQLDAIIDCNGPQTADMQQLLPPYVRKTQILAFTVV